MRRLTLIAVMAAATWLTAVPARAQGALFQGTLAAATSGDETSLSFGAAFSYRFNQVFGLGVELSHITEVEPRFASIYGGRRSDGDGSATIFTTNVRVEIPTSSRRIIPFVVGGGGVASVTQSYDIYYALLAASTGLSILPNPSSVDFTTINMALTLGGGASFLISDHVSIDADLRVLSLLGDADRNIGRFGAGVSYRF